MVRSVDEGVQHGQRAAGDRQRDAEDDETLDVVARDLRTPADTEREPPVGGGVADRGEQQGDEVRRLRPEPALQQQEQHQVGGRRRDADGAEPDHLAEQRAGRGRRCDEPSCAAMVFTGIEPLAKPRSSRPMPLRSAVAVATMSTRLSGSSTQSTGTSWMRSPLRSASTSSSVSKNHPVSATCGSRRSATSARMALKPHCASENRADSVDCRIRL